MEEKDPNDILPNAEQNDQPQEQEANQKSKPAGDTTSSSPSISDNERCAPPSLPELTEVDAIQDHRHVDVKPVFEMVEKVQGQVAQVVIGQEDLIELMLASILVGGHCLIEGLPGIAKTLTAKMLSQTISAEFSRIQFTPDLMPTDITGTSVFNQKESEFVFRKGPIFSNIILIDEINRAPAKTQAALMEVMEERQITYDGKQYDMDHPFFVIATQNPIEQEGTYNLPEAQLDRFLFRIKIGYPTLEEEQKILSLFEGDFEKRKSTQLQAVVSQSDIALCQKIVEQVHCEKELLNYIAALTNNTRNNGDLFIGASPRASLAIMKTAKAMAAIRGRDFVTPDDIKHVALPVLNHRVLISHEREMGGSSVEEIIKEIINTVEIPR